MTLGAPGNEHNRARVGLAVLVVGISFILWSWGHWVYLTSKPSPVASTLNVDPAGAISPQSIRSAVLLPKILMWGTTIVMVGLVGSYVLVRAMRRYREASPLGRSPTNVDDVWSMHKVPDYGPAEDEPDQDRFEA